MVLIDVIGSGPVFNLLYIYILSSLLICKSSNISMDIFFHLKIDILFKSLKNCNVNIAIVVNFSMGTAFRRRRYISNKYYLFQ